MTAPETGFVTACCPRCRKRTDRIQVYDVPLVVFFGYVGWISQRVVGCPDCVRKSLVLRMLASVPLCNLICPIIIPWQMAYFIHSFARSRSGIPAEYAYLIDAVPDVGRPRWKGDVPGKWKRLAVALLILVLVVAAVFLLPALFPGTQARR